MLTKPSWKKLGRIYCPIETKTHPKLISHASNPLAIQVDKNIYRIFYSGRDNRNRSSVGAIDFDLQNMKIIKTHIDPFFEYGPCGSFYSDGVSIGNCCELNNKRSIYFMGWQTKKDKSFKGNIGRLTLEPDNTLELDGHLPLIGIDHEDPFSLSYPCVMPRVDGGLNMWYGSTISRDAGNGEMLHVIKHASSIDGKKWTKTGATFPYEIGKAQAFSRPTVIVDECGFHQMWFSYRNGAGMSYRIGYAWSTNSDDWNIDLDNAGIDVSSEGWDSEMIEYPFVFKHQNEYFMLYNGNGFGRSGFGLAQLVRV